MFGENGAAWSVIYVDIDAHNRNRSIFETLLPRESSTKETDVSLMVRILLRLMGLGGGTGSERCTLSKKFFKTCFCTHNIR